MDVKNELQILRDGIDDIDGEILQLFLKRMELCLNVGRVKKENNVTVLQGDREEQILARIAENSPEVYQNCTRTLFRNIMDFSKDLQSNLISGREYDSISDEFSPNYDDIFACQGAAGAYSDIAARSLCENPDIIFCDKFEDVFKAVEDKKAKFGILPLENSSIGSIFETYDLMMKYKFYINSLVRVKISHCLAAKKGTELSQIKEVYSKEEALMQCGKFLDENNFHQNSYSNTALAAEFVKNSEDNIACVCSESCAEELGLEIIAKDISDVTPNFTRFICFSNSITVSEKSDIISILVSVPHEKGALNRLLTRFSINGLNLLKIESKNIPGSDFEVMFYLDFAGNYNTPSVRNLLHELSLEMSYFRFFGNYSEL